MLAKADEFPELAGAQPIEEVEKQEISTIENHAAAMELAAPSKKKEEMDFAAWAAADAASESNVETLVEKASLCKKSYSE